VNTKLKLGESMNKSLYVEKLDEQIVQIKTKLKDPKLCDGTADTYSRISG
jgi:hypothetical protein